MSRGQIVRSMLEEIGKPYDQVLLDYGMTMKAGWGSFDAAMDGLEAAGSARQFIADDRFGAAARD